MIVDAHLNPWLEIADELERFVEFMHASSYVPRVSAPPGEVKYLDVGESAVAKMRAAAVRPWRFSICRRWDMEAAFAAFFYPFHRRISEGAFFHVEDSAWLDEMMRRLDRMYAMLKKLRG